MTVAAASLERSRLTWGVYGLVGFFAYLEAVLGPVMPFLRQEQDLGFAAASLHFSAFAAGGLVAGLSADRAIASLGRRGALQIGACGMAVGAIAIAAGPNAVVTIAGALVMGTFGAQLLITTQSVLADRYGRWKTIAITESNVVASACAILSALAVGAASASALGWRAAFAPPVVAAALLLLALRSEHLGNARVAARGRAHAPLPRALWLFVVVLFLGVAAEWCIGYWGAEFLTAAGSLSRASAAAAMSAFFVAMLVGRLAISRLARRAGDRSMLAGTLALAAAGCVLMWLARQPAPVLAGLSVTGLGLGGVYPVALSAGVGAAPGATDTAASRLAIAAAAAVLLLPLTVGGLADAFGIVRSFGLVAPMLAAAAALTLVSGRAAAPASR